MPKPKREYVTLRDHADDYSVSLEMDGKIYEGKGFTAYEAFLSIPLDYTQIKVKGTLTLRKENLSASRFMYLKPLRKVFANKLLRANVANNLEKFLK